MDPSSRPTCPVSPLPGRAVLAVTGPDAKSFLDGLVTNDMDRLSPGRALYAGLLSPQGKLLYDFLLAEHEGAVLLDVAAAQGHALAQRLGLYKLRAKVAIGHRPDWGVSVVFGPSTPELFGLAPGAAKPFGGGIAFTDPRLPALGVRVLGPAAEGSEAFHALGVAETAPTAFEDLRLTLGVGEGPEIGAERTYALEANFEPFQGVDFRKGCYVGQELTARMKHRNGLRKRIVPVRFVERAPPVDSRLVAGAVEIGTVLAVKDARGLALVRLDRLADAGASPLTADGHDAHIEWPAWLPPLESATP